MRQVGIGIAFRLCTYGEKNNRKVITKYIFHNI